MEADVTKGAKRKQRVQCGGRIFGRIISDVEETPFGLRGRVRINKRDLIARHWHGNLWTASGSWRPYPGGCA